MGQQADVTMFTVTKIPKEREKAMVFGDIVFHVLEEVMDLSLSVM